MFEHMAIEHYSPSTHNVHSQAVPGGIRPNPKRGEPKETSEPPIDKE